MKIKIHSCSSIFPSVKYIFEFSYSLIFIESLIDLGWQSI